MRISDWSSDVCSSDLRPEKADLATMIEALSRPETRTVKRGVIHYNNQHWTSDVLSRASDLEGEKVTVMVPVVRGFPLAVLDPKGALGDFPGIGPVPAETTKIDTTPDFTTFMTATVGQPRSQLYEFSLFI